MLKNTADIRNYTENEIEQLIRTGHGGELFNQLTVDPNYVFDNSGNSLLHLSVKYGSSNLTSMFIELGCNVNAQNKVGNTALIEAVLRGGYLHIKSLLNANSDFLLRNDEGDTALKLFLRFVNDATTFGILKRFIELLKSTDADSETIFQILAEANCSLTCAVFFNDISVMKLMLQGEHNINDNQFYNGWTALHAAVTINNREIVELLVKHGSDINITDTNGQLPIEHMFNHGIVQYPEIISILMPTEVDWVYVRYSRGMMKLETVFVMGTKETLQLFFQSYQVDWTRKDDQGMTPLHYIVGNINDGIIDLYKNVEFNIHDCNNIHQKTPLHVAAIHGTVEAIKFLLLKGADVDAEDCHGYTPICYTICIRTRRDETYKECVDLFLQYGANLQVISKNGDDIFKIATRCENDYVAKPMLDHLAIIEASGEHIKQPILDSINSYPQLKEHYNYCKEQLMKMKNETVFGTLTLWKFLIDKHKKIVLNRSEQMSFKNMMDANLISHTYYRSLLQKHFQAAETMMELRTRALRFLEEAIVQLGNNEMILNEIIGYLSYEDLLKFT